MFMVCCHKVIFMNETYKSQKFYTKKPYRTFGKPWLLLPLSFTTPATSDGVGPCPDSWTKTILFGTLCPLRRRMSTPLTPRLFNSGWVRTCQSGIAGSRINTKNVTLTTPVTNVTSGSPVRPGGRVNHKHW